MLERVSVPSLICMALGDCMQILGSFLGRILRYVCRFLRMLQLNARNGAASHCKSLMRQAWEASQIIKIAPGRSKDQ